MFPVDSVISDSDVNIFEYVPALFDTYVVCAVIIL